jgi:hypothetical protein
MCRATDHWGAGFQSWTADLRDVRHIAGFANRWVSKSEYGTGHRISRLTAQVANCFRNQHFATSKRVTRDRRGYGTLRAMDTNERNSINGCGVWRQERTESLIGCATSIILEPEEDL